MTPDKSAAFRVKARAIVRDMDCDWSFDGEATSGEMDRAKDQATEAIAALCDEVAAARDERAVKIIEDECYTFDEIARLVAAIRARTP